MEQDLSKVTPLVYESRIGVPYNWWAGKTASRFFETIAHDKKLAATKCDKCGKVFVPPRKTCPECFVDTNSWVSLSGEGTVVTFTVVTRKLAALGKRNPPVIFALIRPDGADTAMLHILDNIAPEKVHTGLAVKPVFSENPKGHITDISHFEPV
ncbi:MAG: Zn-ribbon domain-containing OB-fold protein [Desulfatibacillaceae bacterium]|nr:Zn-ribbon domain-containing OB-fold protein [Desulfatibacillaceae bacterium]